MRTLTLSSRNLQKKATRKIARSRARMCGYTNTPTASAFCGSVRPAISSINTVRK